MPCGGWERRRFGAARMGTGAVAHGALQWLLRTPMPLAPTFSVKYYIDVALTETQKAARVLGRVGGLKGGKARAAKLSPERRKEIAQKAIAARWAKSKAKTIEQLIREQ